MDDLQDRIIFVKKSFLRGEKVCISLPSELQKILGFKPADRLSMFVDTGKHGKYLAVWLDPAEQKIVESESDEEEPDKSSIQEI